jgi:hypothetical protein
VKPWTLNYLSWVTHEVHFEHLAQEATLLDYLHEVEHAELRIARLNLAVEEAVKSTPPKMRAVIEALQVPRGVSFHEYLCCASSLSWLGRTIISRFGHRFGLGTVDPAGRSWQSFGMSFRSLLRMSKAWRAYFVR